MNTESRFRELLSQTTSIPGPYLHKVIGRNSPRFKNSLTELEGEFSTLVRVDQKTSASGAHLSVTYELQAESVDEIVHLAERSRKVQEVILVL